MSTLILIVTLLAVAAVVGYFIVAGGTPGPTVASMLRGTDDRDNNR
jgi:hypothetical protein